MNAIPLPDDFGLRPLRADDAPDIFTAIDTQREHLGRWLPFVADTHRIEQTRQVVAGMLADPANPVFTLRVGDAFAGLIGFKSADSTTRTIEIGYWLRSEYQGRGLMTAAVEALCRTAFGQMGMENVEIKCAAPRLQARPHRSTRRAARRRGVHRPQRIPAATPLKQKKTGKAVPPGSNSRQHPRAAGTASSQSRPGATYRDYPSLIEAISWAGVACR